MSEKKKVNAYKRLIEGIDEIVSSGKYQDFLRAMKKFHKYSFHNRILIFSQNPNASQIAGYCTWKELGRGVKSNPKKIYILRPIKYNKKTGNKNEEISDEKEEQYNNQLRFGWTIVYDIEDTYIKEDGKEIPILDDRRLNSNTSEKLYNSLLNLSPVKVTIQNTGNGADGYYSKSLEKIVLSPIQSEDDKTATLLHEMSHAIYDDFDYKKEKNLSEMCVESITFIVADYFGLDTSKCSFSYITNWAEGDSKKLLKLGSKIQKDSEDFINKILIDMDSEKLTAA